MGLGVDPIQGPAPIHEDSLGGTVRMDDERVDELRQRFRRVIKFGTRRVSPEDIEKGGRAIVPHDSQPGAATIHSSDGTGGPREDMDEETHAETVRAIGHENVTGTHESTLELTSDDWLTKAGDCIIAVESDRAPSDFDREYVSACRDGDATITVHISAAGLEQTITGRGHPDLTFENDRSMVLRTSDYVDDRTVMIEANTAACGLDRDLIGAIAEGADLTATLRVE